MANVNEIKEKLLAKLGQAADSTKTIAAKAAEGKTSVNILLKRRDDNPSGSGDAMKFATKEAADVTATSTDGTEVTFKAADLVPQLTVTYNKVAAPDDPSAVEAVEAAEGAAEYFTLQGVRVANPEHGIFIRVAGGKAKKVVI